MIKQFGELSISKATVRDYTAAERRIVNKGDIGQGERLNAKK